MRLGQRMRGRHNTQWAICVISEPIKIDMGPSSRPKQPHAAGRWVGGSESEERDNTAEFGRYVWRSGCLGRRPTQQAEKNSSNVCCLKQGGVTDLLARSFCHSSVVGGDRSESDTAKLVRLHRAKNEWGRGRNELARCRERAKKRRHVRLSIQ